MVLTDETQPQQINSEQNLRWNGRSFCRASQQRMHNWLVVSLILVGCGFAAAPLGEHGLGLLQHAKEDGPSDTDPQHPWLDAPQECLGTFLPQNCLSTAYNSRVLLCLPLNHQPCLQNIEGRRYSASNCTGKSTNKCILWIIQLPLCLDRSLKCSVTFQVRQKLSDARRGTFYYTICSASTEHQAKSELYLDIYNKNSMQKLILHTSMHQTQCCDNETIMALIYAILFNWTTIMKVSNLGRCK